MRLREEALAAAEEEADIFRTLAQSNSRGFLQKWAASLNNLGAKLSDLGRQEDALQAAKEAVDIRRKLAQSNSQAFLPDLARSLGVYGYVLLNLERYGEAERSLHEGLMYLAPFLKKHPKVFAGLAGSLQKLYLEACWEAGLEPDGDLLSRFD